MTGFYTVTTRLKGRVKRNDIPNAKQPSHEQRPSAGPDQLAKVSLSELLSSRCLEEVGGA